MHKTLTEAFAVAVAVLFFASWLVSSRRYTELRKRARDEAEELRWAKVTLNYVAGKTNDPDIMTIDIVEIRRILQGGPPLDIVGSWWREMTGGSVEKTKIPSLREWDLLTEWERRAARVCLTRTELDLLREKIIRIGDEVQSLQPEQCPRCTHLAQYHQSEGGCTFLGLGYPSTCDCDLFFDRPVAPPTVYPSYCGRLTCGHLRIIHKDDGTLCDSTGCQCNKFIETVPLDPKGDDRCLRDDCGHLRTSHFLLDQGACKGVGCRCSKFKDF